MYEQKKILAINDISCIGKCSITAILPILSALGHETVPLPTAILSTHTGGFEDYTFLDMTDEMKKILKHWEKENINFDCIFTGYLGSKNQIDICLDTIKTKTKDDAFIFVDPVMADFGKLYTGFDKDYINSMKKLCEKADIITPNYTEACFLTGNEFKDIPSNEELEICFDGLSKIGTKSAVVTGIRLNDGKIGVMYKNFETNKEFFYSHPYKKETLHGGGDVFSGVLCGLLLNGIKPEKAIKAAADFTYDSMRNTKTENPYGPAFEPLIKNLENYYSL